MSLSEVLCYGSGKHAQSSAFIKRPILVYVYKNEVWRQIN